MDLKELLIKENINFELLQKSLNHIGLNLLKFNQVDDTVASSIIPLFNESFKIDSVNTRRTEKDSLRYQIEKLLKTRENQKPILIDKIFPQGSNAITKEPISNKNDGPNNFSGKTKKNVSKQEKSFGIVKYIAEDKSHAFILPIQDMSDLSNPLFLSQKGYRAYSNELEDSIQKGQFVFFSLNNNDNRLSVERIDPYLTVYIFNIKYRASHAIILEKNHFHFELPLHQQFESGFYSICTTKREIISKMPIDKESDIIKEYGPQLFSSLLSKHGESYTELISLRETFNFDPNLDVINRAFSTCLDSIENEELTVLRSRLSNIISLGLPENLIQPKTHSFNKISYCLWVGGELPALPNLVNADEINLWQSIIKTFKNKELVEHINRLLSENGEILIIKLTFEQLLSNGIVIKYHEDSEQVHTLLQKLKKLFPEIKIKPEHFKCDDNTDIVSLFQSGILEELSEELISQRIKAFANNELKKDFIESLPAEYIIKLYKLHPELSSDFQQYLSSSLDKLITGINYVSFDIESDGQTISEYSWTSNFRNKSNLDYDSFDIGIEDLLKEINSGKIIIGHNIKNFDLPVLEKFGPINADNFVWDTFEVEMLIHPCRYSYALKTEHNAVFDSNLGLQLFKNQLFLIISTNLKSVSWNLFLPSIIVEQIERIRENSIWKNIDTSIFELQSDSFFRPEPSFKNIPPKTFEALRESLSQTESSLLIAPSFMWETLSRSFNIGFIEPNTVYDKIISKLKVKTTLNDNIFLKQVLLRFIQVHAKRKTIAYYHLLPNAIKFLLSPESIHLICESLKDSPDLLVFKTHCISPDNLDQIKSYLKAQPENEIIILGKELYALTNKLQLGNDFDFATIFDRLKNESIWLQMSGGKNYIKIDQRQCTLLGINKFPKYLNNLWLEKIGKGKFKIWCNLNFENFITDLKNSKVQYIPWNNEKVNKDNAFIVRPDFKKSGYMAEQKRVNPESLFRKLYWIYQFKIFENLITDSKRPKILIVNDEIEILDLTSYARHLGYFVPDTNATLARQIEILHIHKSNKKLLIAPINLIDKIIYSNYIDAIDFIWDSLLLYEKHQMLKGSIVADEELLSEVVIDDVKESPDPSSGIFDLFKLIKQHQPLIDYYYNIITNNNLESRLFLCDTRFTDYHGIESSLGTRNQSVRLWQNEKEYDLDKEVASNYFKSIHENASTKFEINEAKEILRNIFLTNEDSDLVFDWYDYQHLCLNDILPSKKDLLISLPTGAGKSLLFQGPALFRSAFSNKLSIVISPLRALMQDQVDALWNKGFFNNVDFLSGDKSQFEIRDIYRRIAGGEIALLYITPERFRSRSFENAMFTRLDADNGLEFVVFDEAHCISQWGQEFRPDYLNAARKIADISNVPSYHLRKLLFSATISEQVFNEIGTIMPGIELVEGVEKTYNPVRDHISIVFDDKVKDEERLQKIAEYLKAGRFNPDISRAIIFVKSRRKTEECALLMPDYLKDAFGASCNFHEKVGGFHAGMDAEDRKETYEKFKSGDVVILFATKAFGMGMDIPNIHYLAHYSPPSTFEDFLQEIGRAGRNEEKRTLAGFDSKLNPIKTLCLTVIQDFAKLKDQLHQSRISWHEIKEIKDTIEKYVSKFKKLEPDNDIPIPMPSDLYSKLKNNPDDKLDNKFRIALHWLERLERIKLGYLTITHLEFEAEPFKSLGKRLENISDTNITKTCNILLSLVNNDMLENKVVQISIATLRNATKLSLEQLFISLIKADNAGLITLLQEVVIEPTKIRINETNYGKDRRYESEKYVALKTVFSFARSILKAVPSNDSRSFDGDELDQMLNESLFQNIKFTQLPWSQKESSDKRIAECQNYIKDIRVKRSKHAFTVIRLLGKTKHDTKMEKVSDSIKKIQVRHTIFNGYHKSDEWLNKINKLEKDSIKLLDYVAKQYFENNISHFNWPKLIKELAIDHNIQYLSDLFFTLSVLGYVRTGSLLPTGIEVFIKSLDKINETDLQSLDKKIYDEFEQTRKLRELKLISLQVLSEIDKSKYDSFIKRYFSCNSMENLLRLLEEESPIDSPVLKAFRAEAIKTEEDRLNTEQRIVYDSEDNQHINVVAGPGSGKTHTLTLRVARLVHHLGTNPEEILVLAYNRAVVSELKERLSTLFHNLGYDSIARRLKIFTFHGLAKKYCTSQIKDRPFDEWETILLSKLTYSPGTIMNQLGNIKYILVDEFQDINNVRISLLNRLNELTKANLFVIGDPNQSIYGYERIKDGGSLSPWPYYENFKTIFKPKIFTLLNNHRSYPEILKVAGKILSLPEDQKYLLPKPTRVPDESFIKEYVQIVDTSAQGSVKWWNQISPILLERVNNKAYNQIAILFRTNNEVFKGFQKIKNLNLTNVRIRIQGNLPYEFTRIRECHALISVLREKIGINLPSNFKEQVKPLISQLISDNPKWNHFYLRVMHALILDFLEDYDESMTYDNLIEYISELTFRDDGQLYKIYEKHRSSITISSSETEIVLTTMHKVKGLEFDVVLIPPSFSNLPLKNSEDLSVKELNEQIDEEKRLLFVAYSRARYRLIVYKHSREKALDNSRPFTFSEDTTQFLGIPVKPELQKLKIGWAAKSYNFCNRNVNEYIKNTIHSGDLLYIKKRLVNYNANIFTVTEIFKENSTIAFGELANGVNFMGIHDELKGYVVNEVVAWSYEDTCKFDTEHDTDYKKDWCQEARNLGYIYLVDFAGYGTPV